MTKESRLDSSHRKIIGIDIDGTIVDMYNQWNEFSIRENSYELDFSKRIDNPKDMDFWRNPKLYDDVEPIIYSKKVINFLYNKYTIIFISHCYDEHIHSKLNFITRNFRFDGFINTHNKNIVKVDYMIDNDITYLDQFSKDTIKIHYNKISWLDIQNLFTKEFN